MSTVFSYARTWLKVALVSVGLVVRTSDSSDPSTDPSVSASSGAASAAEPNGSVHLRTDGVPEYRISGAWKALEVDGQTIKPAAIDVSAASSSLSLLDNNAGAFSVKEGTNTYLTYATTDGGELIAASKRLTVTDGVSSGTARVVGGRAAASTAASTTISGGSGDQAFSTTYAIPASTLGAGSTLHVHGQIKAIAQNSTDTFTCAARVGGSAVVTSNAVDIAVNDRCVFDFYATTYGPAGASVTSVYSGTIGWTTAGAANILAGSSGTWATNGALIVDATITYGTSSAGNQSALENLYVEIL